MLKQLSPEQQYELDRKILDRLLSKQLIISQEEKTDRVNPEEQEKLTKEIVEFGTRINKKTNPFIKTIYNILDETEKQKK